MRKIIISWLFIAICLVSCVRTKNEAIATLKQDLIKQVPVTSGNDLLLVPAEDQYRKAENIAEQALAREKAAQAKAKPKDKRTAEDRRDIRKGNKIFTAGRAIESTVDGHQLIPFMVVMEAADMYRVAEKLRNSEPLTQTELILGNAMLSAQEMSCKYVDERGDF